MAILNSLDSRISISKKSFKRITKRFTSSSINSNISIPYLIDGRLVVASNRESTVLINRLNLNHSYQPSIEEVSSVKATLLSLSNHYESLQTDMRLTVNKRVIHKIFKYLKREVRLLNSSHTSISYDNGELSFASRTDTNSKHIVSSKCIEKLSYEDAPFSVTVGTNSLIDALLTLKETGNTSTVCFSSNASDPIVFTNTVLKVALKPIRNC